MAYSLVFAIKLGSAYAGVTLAAQFVDDSGVDVGGEITDGFVEIGDGNYQWLASIPAGHRGGVKFYESAVPGIVLDFTAINPEEVEMAALADAMLDREDAIDGKTIRAALRIIAAMLAGKVSGAGTGEETFKGIDGVTDRVAISTDASGNRTAVVYDP